MLTEAQKQEVAQGWRSDWEKIEAAANRQSGDEGEDNYNVGVRDGFSGAVATIDLLTGGDGEYVFSTFGDGCPDPDAMIGRIIARFDARDSDEHPQGENAKRLSGEAMPARAEGIAHTQPESHS